MQLKITAFFQGEKFSDESIFQSIQSSAQLLSEVTDRLQRLTEKALQNASIGSVAPKSLAQLSGSGNAAPRVASVAGMEA